MENTVTQADQKDQNFIDAANAVGGRVEYDDDIENYVAHFDTRNEAVAFAQSEIDMVKLSGVCQGMTYFVEKMN